MAPVVGDPGHGLDDRSHPIERPQVGGVAIGTRPLAERPRAFLRRGRRTGGSGSGVDKRCSPRRVPWNRPWRLRNWAVVRALGAEAGDEEAAAVLASVMPMGIPTTPIAMVSTKANGPRRRVRPKDITCHDGRRGHPGAQDDVPDQAVRCCI